MTAAAEEDALSWAGDEDRLDNRPRVRPRRGEVAATAETEGEAEVEAPPLHPALLVLYGLFGGVYLLYAVGWLITTLRMDALIADPLQYAMYQLGEGLAVAAPLLWAGTVFLLTRGRSPFFRMLWLLLGAVLLLPWPFVLGVR